MMEIAEYTDKELKKYAKMYWRMYNDARVPYKKKYFMEGYMVFHNELEKRGLL